MNKPDYTLQKQIRDAIAAKDPQGLVWLVKTGPCTFHDTVMRQYRDEIIDLAIATKDWPHLKAVAKLDVFAVYQAITNLADSDDSSGGNTTAEQFVLTLGPEELMLQFLLAFPNSELDHWSDEVLEIWLRDSDQDPVLSQVDKAAEASWGNSDETKWWTTNDFIRAVYCAYYGLDELQSFTAEVIDQVKQFLAPARAAKPAGLSFRGSAEEFEAIFNQVLAESLAKGSGLDLRSKSQAEFAYQDYGNDGIAKILPDWIFVLHQYPELVVKYYSKVRYYSCPCQHLELIWDLFETTAQVPGFLTAYQALVTNQNYDLSGTDQHESVIRGDILQEYGLKISRQEILTVFPEK